MYKWMQRRLNNSVSLSANCVRSSISFSASLHLPCIAPSRRIPLITASILVRIEGTKHLSIMEGKDPEVFPLTNVRHLYFRRRGLTLHSFLEILYTLPLLVTCIPSLKEMKLSSSSTVDWASRKLRSRAIESDFE